MVYEAMDSEAEQRSLLAVSSGGRTRTIVADVIISIGAMLLAAVLVEWSLRVLSPRYIADNPEAMQYDPLLGYCLKQSIHLFRTTDYQMENKTNRLGTSNFQESFEGYLRLVLAIGDSYTEGIGVPADASYPFQLDIDLNTDSNGFYEKRYGVANLGVRGYGTLQELIALERNSTKIGRPAIVLYMGCDNDYWDDALFRSEYRPSLVSGNPRWGLWEPTLEWLTNDVQLGIRAKLLLGLMRRGRVLAHANEGDGTCTAELERSRLDRLVADASKYQSLLVVTWSDPGSSYDWLKAWARTKGVAFADWQPKVKSVREVMSTLSLDNQHSGGHHRSWVNRVIADEFARQIHQHGL